LDAGYLPFKLKFPKFRDVPNAGIEKLFEYYVDTYRCTFGLHWDSTVDLKSQGSSDDDLEAMWDTPGVFAVTFESNVPPSKNETVRKLLEKQVKKQKYLEVQALILRVILSVAVAVKAEGSTKKPAEESKKYSEAKNSAEGILL